MHGKLLEILNPLHIQSVDLQGTASCRIRRVSLSIWRDIWLHYNLCVIFMFALGVVVLPQQHLIAVGAQRKEVAYHTEQHLL